MKKLVKQAGIIKLNNDDKNAQNPLYIYSILSDNDLVMNKKKVKNKSEMLLFSSSKSYFDDCPICQAMKEAEEKGKSLSFEETVKAFKKAKEKGAIVDQNPAPKISKD